MAGYEGQKFLHRLARSGGIISSLGMENDSSVGTRPGYSQKGKKVEMCTEPNNLGCPIMSVEKMTGYHQQTDSVFALGLVNRIRATFSTNEKQDKTTMTWSHTPVPQVTFTDDNPYAGGCN